MRPRCSPHGRSRVTDAATERESARRCPAAKGGAAPTTQATAIRATVQNLPPDLMGKAVIVLISTDAALHHHLHLPRHRARHRRRHRHRHRHRHRRRRRRRPGQPCQTAAARCTSLGQNRCRARGWGTLPRPVAPTTTGRFTATTLGSTSTTLTRAQTGTSARRSAPPRLESTVLTISGCAPIQSRRGGPTPQLAAGKVTRSRRRVQPKRQPGSRPPSRQQGRQPQTQPQTPPGGRQHRCRPVRRLRRR